METNINLKDARAFCAVVEKGSITKAAKHLDETKGSVSRRISRLEQNLKVALITRVGGKAQPTSSGARYHKDVLRVIEMLDQANAQILEQHTKVKGTLRVTSSKGAAQKIEFSKICAQFINAYPEVKLEVTLTERLLNFREEQIDFAFRVANGALEDSNHKSLFITDLPIGFAASESYIGEFGQPETSEELMEHRLLLLKPSRSAVQLSLQPVDESLEAKTYTLQGKIESEDVSFLEESAKAGGGIIMKSKKSINNQSNNSLIPILTNWKSNDNYKLFLLFPNRELTATENAFKEFVKAYFN